VRCSPTDPPAFANSLRLAPDVVGLDGRDVFRAEARLPPICRLFFSECGGLHKTRPGDHHSIAATMVNKSPFVFCCQGAIATPGVAKRPALVQR